MKRKITKADIEYILANELIETRYRLIFLTEIRDALERIANALERMGREKAKARGC